VNFEREKEKKMAMTYQAKFHYGLQEGDELKVSRFDIPVQIFEVEGGADRSIKLSSTDDIGISSELEQARTFKNITVYLPSTKDGSDMEIALQLSAFYSQKESMLVSFTVERYSGGQMLEGLALLDAGATLKNSPYVTGKQLLAVHLNLPAAKLYRGKMKGHTMLTPTEM
jgi:hypothetical protein